MTTRARRQFQSVFDTIYAGKATIDVASLADGAGSTSTITIPGVALGDHVISIAAGVDLAGITVSGYVSAANTVALRFQNESGGTLDLASTSYSVIVGKVNPEVLL